MTENKNQHFVPQLYLKRFTDNGYQIYVFDKIKYVSNEVNKVPFKPTNVRNVASQSYFYNLPQEGFENLDRQIVDRALREFEGKYDELLTEIEDVVSQQRKITQGKKEELAIHIALQILRTREFRASYIEVLGKVIKDISAAVLKIQNIDAQAQVSMKEEFIPALHGKMIFNPELLGTLIQSISNRIWIFGVNKTEHPLYTSDNPVVKKSHLAQYISDANGWLSPGVEIVFPLNSRMVLSLQDRQLFDNSGSSVIRHLAENMDGGIIPLEVDHVTYYNSLQVAYSYRQVYCEADDFDLARQICDENPQVCESERLRWERVI